MKLLTETTHRFLDEAGDTTFYRKKKVPIIGSPGVSKTFVLGMVTFHESLDQLRIKVLELQRTIETDRYYRYVNSINKRKFGKGFYFHATDDPAEVRKTFFDFIAGINCSFEAVVARKIPSVFAEKHDNNESEFYADILSHLLEKEIHNHGKVVMNIAERGKTTKNSILELAKQKARDTAELKGSRSLEKEFRFNVRNQLTEPLLNISDYFCWSLQRIFELGEIRYYDYLNDKFKIVIKLYDSEQGMF